jgi:phage FluMu protein Com
MKYNPRQLHLQYNTFNTDIKISVITKFDKKLSEWQFATWKCQYCDTTLKFASTVVKHPNSCKELNSIKKEKEMPIQTIMVKGMKMYRWGDSGKLYKERADAEKQATAAYASGYKEPKKTMEKK